MLKQKKILIVGCHFTSLGLAIHNANLSNTKICKLEKETHKTKATKNRIIDLDYADKSVKKLTENKHPFQKFIGKKKR